MLCHCAEEQGGADAESVAAGSNYHRLENNHDVIQRVFSRLGVKPRATVERDSANSIIAAIEAGRGIALAIPAFKHVSGKCLVYRPLAGTTEVFSIGIARAKHGDVTPAGEKFCKALRKIAKRAKEAASEGRLSCDRGEGCSWFSGEFVFL